MLLEQVETATKRLGQPGDAAEGIHEARKCFKRIRATVRLIRDGIGETAFKRENAAFREIAGRLAGARDRHVLLQTALSLQDDSESERAGDAATLAVAVAEMKKAMRPPEDEATAGSGPGTRSSTRARHALDAARKRIRRLQIEPDSFETIAVGLFHTQRDMVASLHKAQKDQTDEAFHDWRKTVQWHWRHMKLLEPAWPAYFAARAATARELSQLLGDDHDLAMLITFAEDHGRSGLSPKKARVVVTACRSRQSKLRAAAVTLGARMAADRPKDLARHVTALWNVAASAKVAEQPVAASA